MKLKIKLGDEVKIIAGKDKGRKGSILEVNAIRRKVRVKDVHLQTLFDKKEGISKREGFIDYSNVKLLQSAPPNSSKEKKKIAKPKGKSLFAK